MAKNMPRPFRAERQLNGVSRAERPQPSPSPTPDQASKEPEPDYIDDLMSAISRVESRLTSIADKLEDGTPAGADAVDMDQLRGMAESAMSSAAAAPDATYDTSSFDANIGRDLVLGFRSISAGNRRIDGAADELTSVIKTTEQATEEILSACEAIDETAGEVGEQLLNIDEAEHLAPEVNTIRDQVVRIFQASSFQDLTGQRLSNVTQILASIEARLQDVERLMGIEADISVEAAPATNAVDPSDAHFDESGLLNGPADDGISQDDIDKLFG